MHRVCIAITLAAGVLACASANARTAPAPVPPLQGTKVDLLPPAVDLTGAWTTGSGSEPPPGPVVQHPSCAYNPAVWIVEQSGNTLKTLVVPESFNQGIARLGPGPGKVAASPGTISGVDVVIDDGQDRFVLRYDRESGHLRGTRNGASFWAARQKVVRTEACPGIP